MCSRIPVGVKYLTARRSAARAIESGYDMLPGTTSAWTRMSEEPGEAPAMSRYCRSDDTRNGQTKEGKTRTHFEHLKMPPRDSILGCEDLIVAMIGEQGAAVQAKRSKSKGAPNVRQYSHEHGWVGCREKRR